ncbi:MAG: hypothetical protein JSS54_00735 [Proteobacteria bacterium]|nr:hypothetical protein [Pseudomonadota bacterium]MBS0267483.1 hypothetical protein [Pseudomonadota bacterium]
MEDVRADLGALHARMAGIGSRLGGDWAEKLERQLHLDLGTAECAYWHSGYYQALADVLDLMTKPQPIDDTADMPNLCLAAG